MTFQAMLSLKFVKNLSNFWGSGLPQVAFIKRVYRFHGHSLNFENVFLQKKSSDNEQSRVEEESIYIGGVV